MRVLLDTNIIVKLSLSDISQLTAKTRRLLEDETTERLVSTLSIIEIAMKANRGKLEMSEEMMDETLFDLAAVLIPFSDRHARRLFGLPFHHHDPFDRMLISVALSEQIPIVSTDRGLSKYAGLQVLR